jgi:hypothetical protein
MIVIRALDGTAVYVDENAVTLVAGPFRMTSGGIPTSTASSAACW